MEEIESACLDSLNGIPSRRPIIEMTIPSALDKTISPAGRYLVIYVHKQDLSFIIQCSLLRSEDNKLFSTISV